MNRILDNWDSMFKSGNACPYEQPVIAFDSSDYVMFKAEIDKAARRCGYAVADLGTELVKFVRFH